MTPPPMAWPRAGLALAWGGVLVSLALAPALAGAPVWVLALPWMLSAVVLGLPHGAADPIVPFRMRGERLRWGRVAGFSLAYLGVSAAVLAAWWAAPVAAAVGFLVLTWAHWGQGDVFALRALGWDRHLVSRGQLAAALVVRGALPMAVPLVAFPETYAEVVGAMAAAVAPGTEGTAQALILGLDRGALAVALGGLFASYSVWGAVVASRRSATSPGDSASSANSAPLGDSASGPWRTLALDLAEVAGLALFFATVPPLWSVGVYFCLWHALRHLARLAPAVAEGSGWRLAGLAAPATVGALILIGGLAWATVGLGRPVAGVGVYLVGIAALTVPHTLVVVWMDLRQHVWTLTARP